MKFPRKPSPPRRRAARRLACLHFCIGISGCASPGPPRPPSLHLPRWSPISPPRASATSQTPLDHSGQDHRRSRRPARSHRGDLPRTSPGDRLHSRQRLAVHPGPSEAIRDPAPCPHPRSRGPARLPRPDLQRQGPLGWPLRPAFAAAGAAPPPVEHLRATLVPRRRDARVAAAACRRFRRARPHPCPDHSPPKALDQTAAPTHPLDSQPRSTSEPPTQSSDPGGTIDPTAQRDETYRYTAQRVRSITLAGHTLETAQHPIARRHRRHARHLPSQPPTGLAAIPRQRRPSTSPGSPTPIPTSRATSSIASRSTPTEKPSAPRPRLTPTPGRRPRLQRPTALPGQTYTYRITAIDTTGNESPASAEVQESRRVQ